MPTWRLPAGVGSVLKRLEGVEGCSSAAAPLLRFVSALPMFASCFALALA